MKINPKIFSEYVSILSEYKNQTSEYQVEALVWIIQQPKETMNEVLQKASNAVKEAVEMALEEYAKDPFVDLTHLFQQELTPYNTYHEYGHLMEFYTKQLLRELFRKYSVEFEESDLLKNYYEMSDFLKSYEY